MRFFQARLPARPDIFRVFSLTIFLVYSWSLGVFFWNIPRFILFLSLGEMAAIASYSLSIALVDSMLITLLAIVTAFVFPPAWVRDRFVPAGGAFSSSLFYFSILYQSSSDNLHAMDDLRLLTLGMLTLLSLALLVYAVVRIKPLASILVAFALRTEIFFFIYIPLSVLAVITLLVRNAGER